MPPILERVRRHGRASIAAVAIAAVAGAGGLAGCAGSGTLSANSGSTKPSDFVPAGSPVYLELQTDTTSAQWRQVQELGMRLPAWGPFLSDLQQRLRAHGLSFERDIKPLLGGHAAIALLSAPRVHVRMAGGAKGSRAALRGGDARYVAVVQLSDAADAAAAAKVQKAAGGRLAGQHAGIDEYVLSGDGFAAIDDGVLLVAPNRRDLETAIDAHAAGGSQTLSGNPRFASTIATLPADVFAEAYVNLGELAGSALSAQPMMGPVRSLGGLDRAAMALSVSAEPQGLRLKGVVTGAPALDALTSFSPTLASQVPSDAIAYVGFDNLAGTVAKAVGQIEATNPDVKRQLDQVLGQLQPLLGASLDDLKALASGEQALVVTRSGKRADVSVVLQTADHDRTQATLDAIRTHLPALLSLVAPGASAPAATPVSLANGVTGWKVPLSPTEQVVYGVDGKLALIGTGVDGLKSLQTPMSPLSERVDYRAATRDVPAQVTSLAWVDVPAALDLAEASGAERPADRELVANLRHVKSLVAWSTPGSPPTFEVFLTIR
jgi:hypothetical protein